MGKIKKIIISSVVIVVSCILFIHPLSVSAYFWLLGVPNVSKTDQNGNSCKATNLATMCFVGNDLYCIKSGSDQSNILIKYEGYNTYPGDASNKKPTFIKFIRDKYNSYWGKVNGMTYYNGYFYLATGDFSILKVNLDGVIQSYCDIVDNPNGGNGVLVTTYSIASMGNGSFIIGNGSASTYRQFAIVKIIGNQFAIQSRFKISMNTAGQTGQDICYKNGYLYIPIWKSGGNSDLFRSNIGNAPSNTTYASEYYAAWAMGSDLFELESLDFGSDNKLYYCVNAAGSNGTDAVYRL